ncbi:hypothetical protein DEO72_LG4g587 [Vigna unguiculata]|uniref:Uncharacterized protein n=1 Tax=Vigna unguiculata TaxID=3917 RepID=A0A4D6LM26_VIGUN|nr:hypothetical protein DEO72_LG4g587 [Vigna unguiculata]
MTTLHGSRRRHLRQPPWKLVFRPSSRLTVTAPPSSSIRAATAAPPFSPPPRTCSRHHHPQPWQPPPLFSIFTAALHAGNSTTVPSSPFPLQ